MPLPNLKETAAALRALPFSGDVDFQALLDAVKAAYKTRTVIDVQQFHEVCKAAGLDKLQGGGEAAPAPTEEKEGDEEGGKVPEPVPAAPASYSNNAAPLFAVLDVSGKGAVDVSTLLAVLNVLKNGYGEASLKAVLSAFDLAGVGALNEKDLYAALTLGASKDFTAQHGVQLRRAWRSAEKYSDKPAEEGESEGAKPAAVSSGPPRVLIDDFVEKLREDAYLSDALLADVPVPVDAPAAGDEE